MLLENKYQKSYLKAHFKEIKKKMNQNNEFFKDITNSERKIYKKIKTKYPSINDDELKEIIHFSTTNWSGQEIEAAKKLNYCNDCGNCCKLNTPITLKPEEVSKYLNENHELMDNIEPLKDEYKFKQDSPCKYYKLNQCSIFKNRPKSCRKYPFTKVGMHINPQCNNALEILIQKAEKIINEL